MPLLDPPNPFESLVQGTDPGLEYMESQRSWEHRFPYDYARVESFFEDYRKNPKAFPRCKRFLFADLIPLQPDFEKLKKPLLEILAQRRTRRDPGSRSLNLTDLSTLLMAAYGMQSHLPASDPNREINRPVPSPGGLFASEIYFIALNTDGLNRGIYHFQPELASLEALPWAIESGSANRLIKLPVDSPKIENSSGIILITSVFERLRRKYGHRYLRFCLLEAGAICQNFDLIATALGIHYWHQGSVEEAESRLLLHNNALEEAVVYAAILNGSD